MTFPYARRIPRKAEGCVWQLPLSVSSKVINQSGDGKRTLVSEKRLSSTTCFKWLHLEGPVGKLTFGRAASGGNVDCLQAVAF